MKSNRKYHYDEQEGVYVFDDEISINWLLSQILNKKDCHITKVSIEEIETFLSTISNSDLRMPDGQHCIFWLKEKIKEKMLMSDTKSGETWHDISLKYRFILEKIDLILIKIENITEKMEVKKENAISNRTENNIEAHFEPL